MKRSARFAVGSDGVVSLRRRPFVTAVHALGWAIEWIDGRLDDIPGCERDHVGKPFFRGWEFCRNGQWGCRLELHRIWAPLTDAGDR